MILINLNLDNEDYIKIMQQLQTRDISSNDYDILLKLDENKNRWSNRDVTKWKYWDINEESKSSDYQVKLVFLCL